MKRIKLILLTSLFVASPLMAYAADLPTKAPAAPAIGYPAITANGFYVGLGSYAEMTSSTINTGTANTNLNSIGAALEGVAGYQWHIGSEAMFTEVSVNYANLGGSSNCSQAGTTRTLACNVKGPWGVGIEQAFQFDWTYPFQFIPAISGLFNGQNPSTLLPAGATPVSSVPYVAIRADFDNVQATVAGMGSNSAWQVAPEIRLGLINYLKGTNGVLRTYIGYEFGTAALSLTKGATVSSGDTIKAGVTYDF